MNPSTAGIVSGLAVAAVLCLLAYVIAVTPEDRSPSSNRVLAAMRSRRGRFVVAALMVALALAELAMHLHLISLE